VFTVSADSHAWKSSLASDDVDALPCIKALSTDLLVSVIDFLNIIIYYLRPVPLTLWLHTKKPTVHTEVGQIMFASIIGAHALRLISGLQGCLTVSHPHIICGYWWH